MVDFKIVKKNVIDDLCKDPQDNGEKDNDEKDNDERENARKLVASIIKAVEDSEYHLQLLKNRVNDNKEVSKILFQICQDPNISSKFLSNLKKINYKPEDIVLSKINDDVRKNSDKVKSKFPGLNTQLSNTILEAKNNMYDVFEDYANSLLSKRRTTYVQAKKLIDKIRRILHKTLINIKNERLYFFNKGIDRYCVFSSISYIDICMYSITGLLRSLIINNPNIENKTIQLNNFNAFLYFEEPKINLYKEKDAKYKSLRDDCTESEDNADIIYLSLHAYLSLLSLVHEYDKIDNILLEEINSNQYRYLSSSIIDNLSGAEDDEQKIQIIVDEVMKLEESEREEEEAKAKDNERKKRKAIPDKILKLKASLQKITKTTNKWIDTDDYLNIAVAFQEIYLSKSKYNKHTSMTTVRKILNGNKTDEIDISDALFIDKKLIRGFFAVEGMLEEYKAFVEIEKRLRHIFLKCYNNLFDISQCECANSIANNSLDMIHDILLMLSTAYD